MFDRNKDLFSVSLDGKTIEVSRIVTLGSWRIGGDSRQVVPMFDNRDTQGLNQSV